MGLNQAKIESMVEKMPAFPRSVQQVIQLTGDINCPPRELVRVVEHDPVLTGRMLKIVNSSFFGLSRQIVSVKEALAFIGLNTLKHLALTLAAVGALPRSNQAGLDMDRFLTHALAVGATARWIGSRGGVWSRSGDRLFISGLLHNIGDVVLALHAPREFVRIQSRARGSGQPAHVIEPKVIGTTRFEIGAMVADRWRLSPVTVNAIRYHRVSPPEVERTVDMDGLWAGAELVARMNGETLGGPVPATLEDRLGGPIKDLLANRDEIAEVIARTEIFKTI